MTTEYIQDEISTGLQTTMMLDHDPAGLRVRSIKWDSGFQNDGIKPGDLVIAVNGKRIVRPASMEELQKTGSKLIGQYGESQFWSEAGARDADEVTLTVRRRNYLGSGWTELDIRGHLRATRAWRNEKNEPVFGPGGPQNMFQDDGFDASWEEWYDKLSGQLSTILDNGLEQHSLSTRGCLQDLKDQKPRLDFLVAHYPGPFSNALKADFDAAFTIVNGEPRTLSESDLAYRREEDERVRLVTEQAHTAWDSFVKLHAGETIAAFPAVNPISAQRAAVVGKCIVLPPIGNRDWISEAGHTYFTCGNYGDGWYIADAEGPGAQRMLIARERYRKLVSPSLGSQFTFIGRILPNPRLVVIDDHGIFGLQFEILAALVGDAMFIDVSGAGDEARFAGEEQFLHMAGTMPADTASPREVIEAMIAAIKHGDQALWKSLFATWQVTYLDDGRPVIDPYEDRFVDTYWEQSRRNILGKVYGANVVWTGDIRQITSGKEFPGSPVMEEVDVEIEHVGLFDGEYRTFTDFTVNRLWQLQRRDGGPWRVSSVQNL